MERVGIRELRQHASRYVKRVTQGESFHITERGKPVAILSPLTVDPWEQLIATNHVIVPEHPEELFAMKPVDYGVPASQNLAEMRAQER